MRSKKVELVEEFPESYPSLKKYLETEPDIVSYAKFLFGWDPFKYQIKPLKDESKRLLMNFGRQSGKSTICAVKGLHKAMLTPETTVLIVSPTQRQSSLLFRKIKLFLNKLSQNHPEFCRKNMYGRQILGYVERETQTVIEFENGSDIHSLPAGDEGENLRGFTAHMIIIDETAQINNEVFVALQPMFATTYAMGQLILISTPKGIQNFFYDACNKEEFGYKVYRARSRDSPLITNEFLLTQRKQMTENEYRQEYEAVFISEADTFFKLEEIDDVMIPSAPQKTEKERGFEYYFGYDPALMGEDEAVGVVLERRPEHLVKAGANEFAVVNMVSKAKSTISEQIGMIKHLNQVWGFKRITLDCTGFGVEIVNDMQKELGMAVEGVVFSIKTIEELYTNAKKFFEARGFIMYPNQKMRKQLNEMKYEYRKGDGRLNVFNPRKNAKTDYPTALVLALWSTKKAAHDIIISSGKSLST